MTIGALPRREATSRLNSSPPGPLAVAEPADPRRQALEGDPLLGHGDPAAQRLIVGEEPGRPAVRRMSSGSPDRATQRKGPLPSQKSGRMKSGTKPGKAKASGHAGGLGLSPDVVAVVEGHRAGALEGEHRPHVVGHRGHRAADRTRRGRQCEARRPRPTRARPGRTRPARRARSSGRSRRRSAPLDGPARAPARRRCPPGRRRAASPRRPPLGAQARPARRGSSRSGGRRSGHPATLGRARGRPRCERHALVHRHRQRLRAAHAAQAGGEHDAPPERAAEVLTGQLGEAPRRCPEGCPAWRCRSATRPYLAVHRQAGPLQLAEGTSVRPLADQVGVGDEDARGPGCVRRRTTGLPDWTRRVSSSPSRRSSRTMASKAAQLRAARPVPPYTTRSSGRSAALRVEVVHEHPQGRLLPPAAAGELRALGARTMREAATAMTGAGTSCGGVYTTCSGA